MLFKDKPRHEKGEIDCSVCMLHQDTSTQVADVSRTAERSKEPGSAKSTNPRSFQHSSCGNSSRHRQGAVLWLPGEERSAVVPSAIVGVCGLGTAGHRAAKQTTPADRVLPALQVLELL